MSRGIRGCWVQRLLVVFTVWCLLAGGLAVPVGAQSEESLPVPLVPSVDVVEGLVAGQVDGAVGSGSDGFVGVRTELGLPPLDGSLDEDLGRLDESGGHGPVSGQVGVPGPVVEVFGGGFLGAPVPVEAKEGPAPEGFGGLAMCAGGYVCGSAQLLPGPTGLSCSVTASVIVFSWNRVSGADNYTAKLQLAVAGSAQTVRTTSSSLVVFGGLSSSTTYYIGVHSNVGGVAQYYSGVYCTTAVGPPSCGVVSGSGVKLYWGADSRVHSWFVGRATTGSQYTDGRSLTGSVLSTVFTGLEANASYTFFFWWRASPTSAWNRVYPSRVCETTAPPAAPAVVCSATASTIAVSWGRVRGAVRYRVSRGGGWAVASGLSHTFSNLSEATVYSVRVQGGNAAGWGQTGTATCTTLASTLPAPTGLGCEATLAQIRLSWDEVAGADGYSAKIQLAEPGSAQTEVSTASTAATFTGLAASTKYWVSVLAVKNNKPQNFAGVYCTTLAGIAAPVLSCTATSNSVTVSWGAVTGASKYRARAGGRDWTGDLTAVVHTFIGLASGTTHTITVQSGGPGGWGTAATVRCVTASAGVSCDDTTSNSVVLEWDDRAEAEYWYAAISRGTGYVGPRFHERQIDGQTSTTFTGLDKATRYVMLLWWYDGSAWHKTVPPPECHTKHLDTPGIDDSVTTGGSTLTIRWGPVEGAQRYQVQISPAGTSGAVGASVDGGWETVVSTGESHTFTGLAPGTRYTVQLRAVDARGNPSAAATEDRRTSRARCQAVTSSSVTLAWDDPGDGYQWRIRRITGVNQYTDSRTVAKGASTQTTFTGLAAQTRYWFAVDRRMASSDQWEAHTPFPHCHTSPNSPVLAPCPQAADVDGTIRWMSNGAYLYRVTLDRTQTNPAWVITNSTAHTFTGLPEGKTYNIAVQARNPQGWSSSSTCSMTTLPPIADSQVTKTGAYYFTEGTVKGVLYAAGQAIASRNGSTSTEQVVCGNPQTTVTKIQLAAIMLSIPPNEAYSANSRSTVPSPMALSRWDNLGQFTQTHVYTVGGAEMEETKSLNIRLYSHMKKEEDVRAHWSPGVGLWQIDLFESAINMNHAERTDITKGGVEVAKFLLQEHCRKTTNDQGLKSTLNNRWHGCYPFARDEQGNLIKDPNNNTQYLRIPDVCYDIYSRDRDKIYETSSSGDKLNIRVEEQDSEGSALDQVDGGIVARQCRWSSNSIPMPCYIYDTGNPQGGILNDHMNGSESGMTPYPSAFISFTDSATNIKYAVWPAQWPSSSNFLQWPKETVSSAKSIYRAVMPNEYVRCSPGRDVTPESSNSAVAAADCAEEIYKPFGAKVTNSDFDNGKHIVEGWFDDIVLFGNGQSHKLQLQNCGTIPRSQIPHILCWWEDI